MDKISLLIVDDDKADRLMLLKMTEPEFVVKSATTGNECLDFLKKQKFDCVVIDHFLPDYKSELLIKEIKKIGDFPIIVITGQGDETLVVQLMKLGALDYIPKSKIKNGVLSKAIKNAIRLKHSEEKMEYYQNFYNNAPIGFYTTSITDGTFHNANLACIKMLGFNSLEELAKSCKSTDMYSSADREKLLQKIQRQGIVTDFEVELHLPNGKNMWVALSANYCKQGDCIEGSIVNITDKKEIQAELDAAKRESLAFLKKVNKNIEKRIDDSFGSAG